MHLADTKEMALKAYNCFIALYEDNYLKLVQCLTKDGDELFAFYDFPAVHCDHIRNTNPIESIFSTSSSPENKVLWYHVSNPDDGFQVGSGYGKTLAKD